ncbi:hypothetical protein GCM10012279_44160 [Micromonospora yangpuensis]|nr:hypothetical protein GCM10012279_44160 [Micromonospora yangpuensis]
MNPGPSVPLPYTVLARSGPPSYRPVVFGGDQVERGWAGVTGGVETGRFGFADPVALARAYAGEVAGGGGKGGAGIGPGGAGGGGIRGPGGGTGGPGGVGTGGDGAGAGGTGPGPGGTGVGTGSGSGMGGVGGPTGSGVGSGVGGPTGSGSGVGTGSGVGAGSGVCAGHGLGAGSGVEAGGRAGSAEACSVEACSAGAWPVGVDRYTFGLLAGVADAATASAASAAEIRTSPGTAALARAGPGSEPPVRWAGTWGPAGRVPWAGWGGGIAPAEAGVVPLATCGASSDAGAAAGFGAPLAGGRSCVEDLARYMVPPVGRVHPASCGGAVRLATLTCARPVPAAGAAASDGPGSRPAGSGVGPGSAVSTGTCCSPMLVLRADARARTREVRPGVLGVTVPYSGRAAQPE